MTIHVIGCGESGKHWDGSGYSIGVNDAFKWGFPVNELILVNRPDKFSPDRLKTILDCYRTGNILNDVYSHKPADWNGKHFLPNYCLQLPLSPFVGRVKRGIIYKSATSPFIAISKAFTMGASEIIIWGVDFKTHKGFTDQNKAGQNEIFQYKKLIEAIQGQYGVSFFLGAGGSALEQFVDVKKW